MNKNYKNLPKFSIICPIFNSEKYLLNSIQSLLEQSYKNWELILIDDGSTDKSLSLCKSFSSKYPNKIKTIHKKNEGPYIARLTGITNSTGDYILFLDSDDAFKKGYLQTIFNVIAKHNSDIIYFLAQQENKIYGKIPCKIINSNDNTYFFRKTILSSGHLNSCCTQCIKKEIIDIKQLKIYKTNSKIGEDKIMSMVFLDGAKKIFYLEKVLYNYKTNCNSITRSIINLQNIYQKYNENLYKISLKYQKKWKIYGHEVSQNLYNHNSLLPQIWLFHLIFSFNPAIRSTKIIKQMFSNKIIKIENIDLYKTSRVSFFLKMLLRNCTIYLLFYAFLYRFYKKTIKLLRKFKIV